MIATLTSAAEIALEQARGRDIAGHVSRIHEGQRPPSVVEAGAIQTTPDSVRIDYWQEEDGSWAAFSDALQVTAVADTETDIIPAMFEVLEDYWDILNERYDTLSDALRGQLALRYLGLEFAKRQA
jgi:hypothetical protein